MTWRRVSRAGRFIFQFLRRSLVPNLQRAGSGFSQWLLTEDAGDYLHLDHAGEFHENLKGQAPSRKPFLACPTSHHLGDCAWFIPPSKRKFSEIASALNQASLNLELVHGWSVPNWIRCTQSADMFSSQNEYVNRKSAK